jgi:hypothetical protein
VTEAPAWRRGPSALAALFLVGLAAGDLRAAPAEAPGAEGPVAPAASLSLRAAPVFGTDAACGEGWLELVAIVDNAGTRTARGTLEVEGDPGSTYAASAESRFLARAQFDVAAHGEVVIRLPVRAQTSVPALSVAALGPDGRTLAQTSVSLGTSLAPLLVDFDQPSRLSVVMRGWSLSPAWRPPSPPYLSPGATLALTVGSPAVHPTTGDLVLPEHAVGYASATVVVVPSDRLGRLQGAELDALVGWVLAGGTLAVFPTRPEDLRAGVLATLVGGAIGLAPAPARMMTLPGATRGGPPAPAALAPPPRVPPAPWTPLTPPGIDAGTATPIGWFAPVRTTPFVAGRALGPSAAVRATLVGYAGGNLHPTDYGATAPYGLGQVHVLGFDPTTSAALDDPWVHGRILDMIGDAWDRRALLAMPNGSGTHGGNLSDLHRALDPNENFRPALGVAAILLVLYSIGVGPLIFLRAKRRGKMLEPLLWAPAASAACFALIVVVGLAGKGWSGRARRIALVEAGAGMSRGSVRRFRGFFASQTRAMRVRSAEPTSVLELVTTDTRSQGTPVLHLDRDGASLDDLTSLPWQTVVVSEDGFTELGAGIAVQEKEDGSVVVSNGTGRGLRNVLVWAPQIGASFFAAVGAGDRVVSTGGRPLFTAASRPVEAAGTRDVHALELGAVTSALGPASEDLVTQWSAMASAAGSSTDWWPDDVPVVLGELRGGEGAKTDSGLRVESDVLLVRVLGQGGSP